MRLIEKLREFLKDQRTRRAKEKKLDCWEQAREEWRKLQEENRRRVHDEK